MSGHTQAPRCPRPRPNPHTESTRLLSYLATQVNYSFPLAVPPRFLLPCIRTSFIARQCQESLQNQLTGQAAVITANVVYRSPN